MDLIFRFVEENLDDVLTQALLMDRVGFIEVLILNGFSLYRFLTVKKLRLETIFETVVHFIPHGHIIGNSIIDMLYCNPRPKKLYIISQ